jgi:elongator complex protein 3
LSSLALIRELHVYGELVPVGNPSTLQFDSGQASSGRKRKIQHAGLGKKLLKEAEKITRENGYKKIAVISGVGVRDYYRKLGYRLEDTYMIKSLTP